MKALRWLPAAGMILSIAYAGRQLAQVNRLTRELAALPAGASPLEALGRASTGGAASDLAARLAAGELAGLEEAARAGEAGAAAVPASPRVFSPRPSHVEIGDTNSAGGTLVSSRGGAVKPRAAGGAVIIGADGSRLEIAPPDRPGPSAAETALRTAAGAAERVAQAVRLPDLDDRRAGIEERRARAQYLMIGAVAAFAGLLLWARRFRPDIPA